MNAVFLSRAEVYNGNYSITKRDASHEFTRVMHYHDFYEMQFYLGESDENQIGEITINGKTRQLKQGCMVLINMFDTHQIKITCNAPYTRYCISFDPSLLLFSCSNSTNLFNIFSNCADVKYSQPLTSSQIKTFIDIYYRHEHLTLTHGRDVLEKAIILEIFANIYDIFYDGQQISDTESRNLALITELINYIDANIADDLSLERLAEQVNFSTFHLSRLFKRYTGTTLNKYIVTKRIDKAKLLLKDLTSITAVSKEVGFNNYNHFFRTFKNITGLSPADYKETIEKGETNERIQPNILYR